jgi:hypothetical protein
MPVTAKLSRKFYERLGDDIANELVDWFNAVDDTYRTQLRDLNELNWNRFQAAMDARFAEFEGKMDRRFAEVDAKMDRKFAEVDVRFSSFEAKIERRFTENTRWMLGLWLATVIPLGGLMVGLFNSVR